MNNIQHNILEKIKTGEVDMRPKWHFVLRAGLLVSGVIMAGLIAVYLLSFVLFFMHQSGVALAWGFGFRGISFFVMSSPLLLIGVSVAFLVLLYFLVKQYSFSYKRPLLYSMVGVIALVLMGSWFIQQTLTHQRIGLFMDRNEVPVFGSMYRGAMQERPEGMLVGVITELSEDGFVLESEGSEIFKVILNNETRLRPGTEPSIGMEVVVFGDRDGDAVTAFGVRPHDEMRGGLRTGPRGQEGQLIRPMPEGRDQLHNKPFKNNEYD